MNTVFETNEMRTFPTKAEFIGDKKINDIIYGFYQTKSYLTPDKQRYCLKKDVSAAKIIEYFNSIQKTPPVSERTIRNINKLLIAAGVFVEGKVDNKKVFFLPDMEKGKYVFIKTRTLEYLVNTANSNVIKVYAFLKMKQQQHDDMNFTESYRFSKTKLLEVIGYPHGQNKSDQLKMISDILTCLENNDLINIHTEWVSTGNDNGTQYFVLDAVNDDYKEQTINSKKSDNGSAVAVPIKDLMDADGEFKF